MPAEPAPGTASRADPTAVETVAALATVATPRCGQVLVVAVDGPSGSGKTTLARAVGRRLDARVLHMDALYPGWDGLSAAPEILTTDVLEPFARGVDAAYRRWDWVHARPAPERQPLVWTSRLVVEGCGSSALPAGPYAAVHVWVEAPTPVRYARAMARDGDHYRPHWDRWAAQEQALFTGDRTRGRADLVISTT
ncbi:MAG: (d)CMP kinase [Actinomycetota bacterium]|nr:(d)CMP kinase [Actinomycetota bacterium]